MALSFQDKITPVAPTAPAAGGSSGLSFANKITPVAASSPKPEDSIVGTLTKPLVEGVSGLKDLYGGGESGIANKLKQDVQAGASDISAGADNRNLGEGAGQIIKGIVKSGARTAGDIAGTVYAPVGTAIGATGIGKAFDWAGKSISGLSHVADIPAVQEFAMKHPNAGEDFSRVLNIIMGSQDKGQINPSTAIDRTVPQIKAVPDQIKAVAKNTGDMYNALTTKSPEKLDAYISEKFQKGVRPSVSGKNNLGQVEKSQDRAVQAVKTIADNKPNLKITNQYGEETGKLPTNLNEFSQAIDQTKKSLFEKYDALQKTAGENGAKVELTPVSEELRNIQNNPTVKDLHPDIADYAMKRADALSKRGTYTTSEAQDAVQTLNKSLESFYKNPTYDTASRASVDAMIANKLRAGLDETIESSNAPGYQDLKNQYGSLKSIEKDVVHRALVDARKNTKGLIDFTDIATGAEVVKGLMTMDPVSMTTGLGAKAIAAYYKYLNNPNTSIKKMFQATEKGTSKLKLPPAKR